MCYNYWFPENYREWLKVLFFDAHGNEFLHCYTPGFEATQMDYVPSEPNELLLRKGKEFIVLDLTCFPLKN